MREEGHSPVLSINIGTFQTAPARRKAYIAAAKKAKFLTLGAWCKAVLDKAAKFKNKEPDRYLPLAGLLILFAVSVSHGWDWQENRRQQDASDRLERIERTQQDERREERERRAEERQAELDRQIQDDRREEANHRRRLEEETERRARYGY